MKNIKMNLKEKNLNKKTIRTRESWLIRVNKKNEGSKCFLLQSALDPTFVTKEYRNEWIVHLKRMIHGLIIINIIVIEILSLILFDALFISSVE